MHTTTIPALNAGLKRYHIRIRLGRTTASQSCIARTSAQAWNLAFDLSERLLGGQPPQSISVRPGAPTYGIQKVTA
jgi:hypothetical protein